MSPRGIRNLPPEKAQDKADGGKNGEGIAVALDSDVAHRCREVAEPVKKTGSDHKALTAEALVADARHIAEEPTVNHTGELMVKARVFPRIALLRAIIEALGQGLQAVMDRLRVAGQSRVRQNT